MTSDRTNEEGQLLLRSEGLPDLLNSEGTALGAISRRVDAASNAVDLATTTEEIQTSFAVIEDGERELAERLKQLIEIADRKIQSQLSLAESTHEHQLRPLRERREQQSNRIAATTGLAMLAAGITGGTGGVAAPLLLVTAAMVATQNALIQGQDAEIEKNVSEWQALSATIAKDKNHVSYFAEKQLFWPTVMSHRASHSKKIFDGLTIYANNHGVSIDEIGAYLNAKEPDVARSFWSLLKAHYTDEDVQALVAYGSETPITASPGQRAFLQFINHALIPHIDYFEIWASKIHDLEELEWEIKEKLGAYRSDERKKLEILGEKPIALSGKRDLGRLSPASTAIPERATEQLTTNSLKPGQLMAQNQATEHQAQVLGLSTSLISALYDPVGGSLKERHEAVKEQVLRDLKTYNGFFGRVDTALRDIDAQVMRMTSERDRVEFQWERAEATATQLKLLALRHPDDVFVERLLGDLASAAGTAATMGPDIAVGSLAGNQVRNVLSYRRATKEYRLQMESALKRSRISPEDLEDKLKKLDEELRALTENQDFQHFLASSQNVQDTRALLMLLPRIVSGENNIDALEALAKKVGYTDIDGFVEDLGRYHGPRLAQAMENHLFGLADTNDLRVLRAEANHITAPKWKAETLLVDYVETVIKRHYPDQSRQASIMDQLMMRNVIPTRKPFYSFGEVVKLETDSALQALLGGTGEFSFVGSKDVRDLFAYYMVRHGDDVTLSDPHDPSRVVEKRVHVAAPEELENLRNRVTRMRNPDMRIPRPVSSVFPEICANEYLLSQGINAVKNPGLSNVPQALAILEMANETTREFIRKLALYEARRKTQEAGVKAGVRDAAATLGPQIEGLLALSFINFFSELGAQHAADRTIGLQAAKVARAFSGENFSLANETYKNLIVDDAGGRFELFLNIYKQNLERYLGDATRENKEALIRQLDGVRDIMAHIQITDDIVKPESEAALLDAHYRNHSLVNVGLNRSTWVERSKAVVGGTKSQGH